MGLSIDERSDSVRKEIARAWKTLEKGKENYT